MGNVKSRYDTIFLGLENDLGKIEDRLHLLFLPRFFLVIHGYIVFFLRFLMRMRIISQSRLEYTPGKLLLLAKENH
ncbi:hypothetical protein SAMN05428977_101164 [Nitrosomonas sp. Nm166]|nr:hypothetical protein SAMN05428977_101164 [Nitrosomonas sp. Nm166]